MSKNRFALLSVAVCLLVHGSMAYFLFPHEVQFSKYTQAAAQYLADTLPSERLADFSPLYLYAHVLMQKLLPGSTAAMLWVQLAATAAATGGLLLLLASLLPIAVSLVGVGLFIFSPVVVTYACIYEPEAFLLLFLIWFVYFAMQDGMRYRFLAGALLACSLLVRLNFLPFLLLAPLVFYLRDDRATWLRGSLVFVSLPLAALLLLSARNARELGTWSPTGMNPGYVFFEGNNPLSSGQSAVYPPLVGELKSTFASGPDTPHVIYREMARRIAGRHLDIAEVNSFWIGKALNFIADHPGRFLRVIATKAWFVVHEFRRFDLEVAYKFAQQLKNAWVPATPFPLLVLLSVVGLWGRRRRWRDCLLPGLLIACQLFVMLLMYVSDRQRLVIVPFLTLFACFGLNELLGWSWRWRSTAVAALIAGTVALAIPSDRMLDTLHCWKNYGKSDQAWLAAIRLRDQGQFGAAAFQAVASLSAAPWLVDASRPAYLSFGEDASSFARLALAAKQQMNEQSPSGDLDRAMLMEEAGELDSAVSLLEKLRSNGNVFDREYLQSAQPGFFLARIAARRGNVEQATEMARLSLARAPGDPYLLALLAALTGEADYERLLVRYFGEIESAFWTGKSCLELGRFECAVDRLSYVVAVLPEYRRAWIYLAAAHAGIGDDEQGARLYDQVSSREVDAIMLEKHILPLYRRRVQAVPVDPLRHFRLGAVLAHYGHLAEAIAEQRLAFSLTGDANMQRSIRRLEAMSATTSTGGFHAP